MSQTTVRRHRALENEAKSQPELINIVSLDDGGSENEGEVELDGVREDYFDDMVLLQPEGKQSKYTIDMCNIDNATKLASGGMATPIWHSSAGFVRMNMLDCPF